MKAIARSLRISPKKLNLIADLIRNKKAVEAMEILDFAPKKGAQMLSKVVKSAVANAKNNFKQDENSLFIKEIVVNKATTYKRWVPASRGRTQARLKRNAHVSITIGVDEAAAKAKPATKKATKKATPQKKAPAKTEPKAEKKEVKKTEAAPKESAKAPAEKKPQKEQTES